MRFNFKSYLSVLFLVLAVYRLPAQGNSIKKELPKNWYLLDKGKDGFYGISLEQAYEFLRSKKIRSKTVLVAVIDAGIDTAHEDLKGILWNNPKEIPGNGLDDDHNGYADDVHGWNFLGGKDGKNVNDDSGEDARIYYKFKGKFEAAGFDPTTLSGEDLDNYHIWLQAKLKVIGERFG